MKVKEFLCFMPVESPKTLSSLPMRIAVNTAQSLQPANLSGEAILDTLQVDTLQAAPDSTDFPRRGQQLMSSGKVDGLITLGPETSESAADAAVSRAYAQHRPGTAFRDNMLIIASDRPADMLESRGENWPIVRTEMLDGILKEEEVYRRYGAEFPLGEQTGALQLSAILMDRLIRRKLIGEQAPLNYLQTEQPTATRRLLWQAELHANNPQTLYVHTEPGQKPLKKHPNTQPRPTSEVMAKAEFFDHVPLATGEHTPAITMLIAATELAQRHNLPIGKVIEAAGMRDEDVRFTLEMQEDYERFHRIKGEVLDAEGVTLTTATPVHIKRMNEKMRLYPRLGQLVGSAYDLVQHGLVNLDQVAEVEKQLFARKWSGAPDILREVMPEHLMIPGSSNDQVTLANRVITTAQGDIPRGVILPPDDLSTIKALHPNGERTRAMEDETLNYGPNDQEQFEAATRASNGYLLFNEAYNYAPWSKEMDELRLRERVELASGNYSLMLPAHIERGVGGKAAAYYAGIMPPEMITLSSKDDTTIREAAESGINVIKEQDILNLIKWEEMYRHGFLPQEAAPPDDRVDVMDADPETEILIRRSIDGTKGRTLNTIDQYDRARGINTSKRIMVDTDAQNHGLYQPAEFLMLPYMFGPADREIIGSLLAKTGDGRRNHTVFSEINQLCNSDDPRLQLLGTIMSQRVWQLTGESATTRRMWDENVAVLGYGFETFRNIWLADQVVKDPTRRKAFAQVANPETKGENGDVNPVNDWVMTSVCAQTLAHVTDFYRRYGVLPPDYFLPNAADPFFYYKEWNRLHAGKFDVITVPHDVAHPEHQCHAHKRNITVRKRREVVLPPLGMWEKLGFINYAQLRQIKNYGRELTPSEMAGNGLQ